MKTVTIQKNWQELIRPNKLQVATGHDPKREATVVAEPLERGFGVTLGNALRRILLSSLQGAATTPDQTQLIVADYAMGLHFIDRATKSVQTIGFAGGTTLLGIDGLLRHGDALIGVQNGVNPQRIIAITLAADGRSIASVRVLSANDPNIPEPSLGTIADDKYCVVANAQWSKFKDDGTRTAALDPVNIACIDPTAIRK